MKTMKRQRVFFAVLLLLTFALACAVPALPSASQPPPTPDTRLGTMIAGTVSAALELTALSVPTEPQPPPTAAPEPTAVPGAALPVPGSTLTAQDNGSVLFVDENAGYRITVPAGWLAVRLNEREYYDAFLLPQAANERIQTTLQSIRNQDPATFRLLIVDVLEGHIQHEIVTNVNLIWDPNTTFSFDSGDDLQSLADTLPSGVDGLTVTSVDIVIPPGGIAHGEIQSEIGGYNVLGQGVTLHQKMMIFNLRKGALAITFTTESGFSETTLPMFGAMIETLVIETE
jgi:hypothetical protein